MLTLIREHCKDKLLKLFPVVPVAATVSADETEALKAEITKAVEKVQEAGELTSLPDLKGYWPQSSGSRKMV